MPVTYNLAQIDEAVQYIIKNAKNNVLLFYGEMGAGKTTLIKALVKALGSEDRVSSPTFSLVNEYHTPREPIYHFDFYRLEDPNEALDIGLEEYLNSNGWILIEWPQKIQEFLEENFQKIEISIQGENTRMLNLC
ncbi:tRNA threonylcarbamoyladenosine biosynthesis protein TsaE [Salegentibacter salinarum]|uniref:tRNA threonylcarbamoyladenosine biosynthesis protein TsaE n=1 Tax=Salegentibacter salinarum TaxID=447422 RepID=A0A2N0TN06_9FLAO|nr:tRNA (adenosine(37)-N6)-threonylcarbamoyltransferase complex ATPase subunit type 1 TsaE [Salegentibacter salinarum]PKD16121.1 tRNA threonylcarbamoyladenosine biosynthesis protein TsaE [Salegentibacter salinarum]SKB69121.1 tRNA threonylcarbamoyladenosine biosynthesis protein TsaE [Salegentibacter salinarum]